MKSDNWKYYSPAIVWLILIFIVSSIPELAPPALGLTFSDKLAHISEYFILGALGILALKQAGIKRPVLMTFLLGTLYGCLDEVHQHFVPGRSMDIFDAIADMIGIAAGLVLFFLIDRFKRRAKPEMPASLTK